MWARFGKALLPPAPLLSRLPCVVVLSVPLSPGYLRFVRAAVPTCVVCVLFVLPCSHSQSQSYLRISVSPWLLRFTALALTPTALLICCPRMVDFLRL